MSLPAAPGRCLRSVSIDSAIATESPAEPDSTTTLVADMTRPYGMNFVPAEAISLVTGLAGTGEDPPQTPQRAALLAEMRRREIANPSNVLASPDTALVLVKGLLRPGIQKGDRFDVEVCVPTRSDTKSLRGGWLLPARLTELAVLDQQIHNGRLLGTAEGPLLIDPAADVSDAALLTRGRVLGGGMAHKDRALGLIIDEEFQSVATSQKIGAVINRRFHTFASGTQRGVARPKTDEFIELKIHPRYKDNVARYMKIVRRIAVNEAPTGQLDRLRILEDQLRDPLTASEAALRLEAIGGDAARDTLKQVLAESDIEVRFYAAESLAYLDDSAAAETLAEAARNEPAFRLNAMAALAAMDDPLARQALTSLLGVKSAETQYGAFRALWSMDPHDPLIEGERLGDQFSYHRLPVAGPPMIHATRSFRPELVLFGTDHPLRTPLGHRGGEPDPRQRRGQFGDRLAVRSG